MSFSHKTQIEDLLQQVNESARDLDLENSQNQRNWKRLQLAASQLSAALDTPEDTIQKIVYQTQYLAIIRTAIEGGWFDALGDGDLPKTAADLAKRTGAEEILIVRCMRALTAAGLVFEKGPQTYASTPVTRALSDPKVYHGIKHYADEGLPIWAALPKYLEKNGYRTPKGSDSGPFVEVFGMSQWEYFKANPARGQSFNLFMEAYGGARSFWLDTYPAEERLGTDECGRKQVPFLVDIGGGKGHDIRYVKNRIGDKYGRLILQDLPEVVSQAEDLNGIEVMAYDIFTPQPVRGARAYYLRAVLHDWDDESCRKILMNQAAAMGKGFSRLIINETLVPETQASSMLAGMDISMMTLVSGMERTKTQWHHLLDASGFSIVDIWQLGVGAESVIEAELKH